MLQSASDAIGITVDRVDFGNRQPGTEEAWLCYIADPAVDNRVTALTATSAVDHFKRFDPNGFSRNAGSRIAVTVYEIETSSEASFVLIGDEGKDVLVSPWQRGLVVVRATFNYTVIEASATRDALR